MTRTLRIGTWNILGRNEHRTGALAKPGAVRAVLEDHLMDVLCLQEVHFFDGEPDPQLCRELRESGLEHFMGLPLSASHLDSHAQLGVGVASRHPVSSWDTFLLTRPHLTAQVRGRQWVLHEKGMVGCALNIAGDETLWVYSLHLFPFFEFGVADDDDLVEHMWQEFWHYCDQLAEHGRLVLAGDFNQQNRERAAARWSRRSWQFCFTEQDKTSRGLSLDDVALSWRTFAPATDLIATFSDHALAVVEMPVTPGAEFDIAVGERDPDPARGAAPSAPAASMLPR